MCTPDYAAGEGMSDKQFDRASDNEQRERDAAIATARRKAPVPDGFDGQHCTDCDDEIPPARLDTGAHRCIDCQRWFEKWGNRNGQ